MNRVRNLEKHNSQLAKLWHLYFGIIFKHCLEKHEWLFYSLIGTFEVWNRRIMAPLKNEGRTALSKKILHRVSKQWKRSQNAWVWNRCSPDLVLIDIFRFSNLRKERVRDWGPFWRNKKIINPYDYN